MTDYSKTKIYKIESLLGDKIYIGSTAKQYLSQRFAQHKIAYKAWKAGKAFKVMSYDLFDLYGLENCNIILIEEFVCTSKDAKNAREAFFIKELNCVNKCIPGRTVKQYHSDHKDELITYQKEYYKIHNLEHLNYMKEYNLKNADKLKEYYKIHNLEHLNYMKEYYKKNKDQIITYQLKNADKLKEYRKEYYKKKKALKLKPNEDIELIV